MPTPTLAQHNKALMQEIFAGIATGDSRLFVSHLARDATMTITGENSWSQECVGKERILEVFRHVRSKISGPLKTRAFRFFADDDWVIIEGRGDMTTISGEPYRNHYCLLYRVVDDMIVEIREYQDSAMGEARLGACPESLKAVTVASASNAATSVRRDRNETRDLTSTTSAAT